MRRRPDLSVRASSGRAARGLPRRASAVAGAVQEAADRLGGHDAVGEDLVPARARHGGGTLAALLDAADDDSDTLAVLARTVLDLLDRED